MKKVIYTCDRCRKEVIMTDCFGIFDDSPPKWQYISDKLLCNDCINDYCDMLYAFIKQREENK